MRHLVDQIGTGNHHQRKRCEKIVRLRRKKPGGHIPYEQHANAKERHNAKDHRQRPVNPSKASVHKRPLSVAASRELVRSREPLRLQGNPACQTREHRGRLLPIPVRLACFSLCSHTRTRRMLHRTPRAAYSVAPRAGIKTAAYRHGSARSRLDPRVPDSWTRLRRSIPRRKLRQQKCPRRRRPASRSNRALKLRHKDHRSSEPDR